MTFDRADLREYRQRKAKEKAERGADNLKTIVRAAVSAEKLTGNEDWDRYLTAIQGVIESLKSIADYHRKQLESPDVVSHEDLMKAKMELLSVTTAREFLEYAISLPSDLESAGAKAREYLERYEVE